MELIKKILQIMLAAVKKVLALLKGENTEDMAKKLLLALGALFLAVCTGKSLKALSRAKDEAGKKYAPKAKKCCGKKCAGKGKGSKKKSLAKKLVLKALGLKA